MGHNDPFSTLYIDLGPTAPTPLYVLALALVPGTVRHCVYTGSGTGSGMVLALFHNGPNDRVRVPHGP